MKPKVIVICGPTASGKTALSIELAKKIDGEIVSADSMQIYKDMDIGSAKPSAEEMQGIKHYMLDFVSPEQRYNVADYKEEAVQAIEEILKKGKVPIVVGGTGLYVDSLIYGIEYPKMEFDEEYRKELEKRAEVEGLEELYKETGKTKTEQEIESRKNEVPYDYKVFAINMDRELLYNRINKRVDIMIEQGLIEEVKNIVTKYLKYPTAMQALGYKEIKEYLDGIITKEEAIEKVKQETRRYAKRQLTWFRKNKDTVWIDGADDRQNNINIILEEVNFGKN